MKNASVIAVFLASFLPIAPAIAIEGRSYLKDSDVYTLYSTNYPKGSGRSGVATFDLNTELFNRAMCEDAADLYKADFEKLKTSSRYDGITKMRYWCEKGRFRP